MTAPALRTTARPSESLDARLAREQSTLQARSMAAVVLAVIGVVALALVASAWLMADGRWMTLPRAVPIAVWAAALAVAAGLVWALRTRNADVLSLTSLAVAIEREQALRSGSLRGALEVASTGVLGARASQDVARRLAPGVLAALLLVVTQFATLSRSSGLQCRVLLILKKYFEKPAPRLVTSHCFLNHLAPD